MFKSPINYLPFDDYFTKCFNTHNYPTRQANNFNVTNYRPVPTPCYLEYTFEVNERFKIFETVLKTTWTITYSSAWIFFQIIPCLISYWVVGSFCFLFLFFSYRCGAKKSFFFNCPFVVLSKLSLFWMYIYTGRLLMGLNWLSSLTPSHDLWYYYCILLMEINLNEQIFAKDF